MNKIGIYPGTFDPMTNGHMDIVKRSIKIVDKLIIAVSESSKKISQFVVAASFQDKGFDLHHSIFSMPGSITQKKLDQAIEKSGINKTLLKEK